MIKTMNEERLTCIETKLAYLEDFLNQLQEVTVEQGNIIERLVNGETVRKDIEKDYFEFRNIKDLPFY